MQTITRYTLKLTAVLLLVAVLFGSGLSPVKMAAAAPCVPTVTFDLWAKTGTANLYGSTSVNIWGYSLTSGGAASLPGPVLSVTQGACVGITLHNTLSETTSLLFQGQNMTPDVSGVAQNGSFQYVFAASNPGTFLYEAGLLPGTQHQIAMGLYGALIVRPSTPNQAYDGTTTYNDEAILVLSEFDTALYTSPNTPDTFDMRKFAPKYFLINGKAYPAAASISTIGGHQVLLRYLNAGLQAHSMSLLGFSQTVIAQDGSLYAHPHTMASETIAPGQTLDTLVSVPAVVANGKQFALYDANMLLRNSTGTGLNAGLGGMLTLLTVAGGGVGTDTTGPLTSGVAVTPNPTNGSVSVALTASVSDATTGNANVSVAEYFIDVVGANGSGTAMSGAFGSATVAVNATLSTGLLAGLSSGNHTIYVHGQDSLGNWGATSSVVLSLDKLGPTSSALSLSPNPTNGSINVALTASASDTANGNSNVVSAQYDIDGGSPQPMNLSNGGTTPTANLSATIPAATVNGLTQGNHTVNVRSTDSSGNVGATASITLKVDKTGPTASGISAAPNPNNGTLPLNTSVQAVRVSVGITASSSDGFSDAASGGSNVIAAEGFLDVPGTTGTGFVFIANDGNFNSITEDAFADIPLVVINSLSTGSHPICVHAKDAAGNWGAFNCSYNLNIDRTPPTVLSISTVGANPTSATSVQWQVTFSEAVTGVTAGNFSIVRTGLGGTSSITSITGGGATWTVTATTGTGSGTIGLNLTSPTGISDLAGNAMTSAGLPFVGQVFTVAPAPQPSLYFSTSGNGSIPGLSSPDDADIYFYNGTAFSRSLDANGTGSLGLPSGANVDGFDRVDATHFYMSFNGAVAVPVLGTVQDEDVVYYNAGTWSLYYDGSANGVTSNLDAISIVGGSLYFSLSTTTVPPGAGGTGDDADIYRWNGGSSYTRVIDANGTGSLGLPSGANVDGFVRVDATHFYLSFINNGGVALPGGAGTAQDEDVVYYNAGVWSIYFDGSVVGLGSADNQDIDAFDLP